MTALTDQEKGEMLDYLDSIHNPEQVVDPFALEDGVLQARLDKIYFYKAKGKNKLVIEFEILSGNYINRTVFKWCNLQTKENLDFVTIDLRRLGIKQFKWSNLEEKFPSLLDKCYEIELATNEEGFQNVYIRKEIAVATESQIKPDKKSLFEKKAPEPQDDIPF